MYIFNKVIVLYLNSTVLMDIRGLIKTGKNLRDHYNNTNYIIYLIE